MTGRHAYFLLFLFAAASLLCACGKEEVDCAFDEKKEIIFVCDSLEMLVDGTKADVTSLSKLNVLCQKGNEKSLTKQWYLTDLTVSSGTVSSGKYWPSQGDYDKMGGYHFFVSNTGVISDDNGAKINVYCNNEIDYICGYEYSPDYGKAVSIACFHVQSKLGEVKVAPADSAYSISNLAVSLKSVVVTGRYDLYSDSWKTFEKKDWTIASVSDDKILTKCSGKYLIPGSYTVQATYTVTKGNCTYTQSTPVKATVTFTKAMINNLDIKLPIKESTLGVTVNVTDWTTGADYYESM